MRPPLLGLLCVPALLALGAPAAAQGVSARFSDRVATIGADVRVRVEVQDRLGIVDRVQVELRRPDRATWTATAAAPLDAATWAARFEAPTVWGGIAPPHLEVRALLYGRRGGLLLVLGQVEPFEMDVLTPARAARRAQDLSRPAPGEGGSAFTLAGYVGAEGRAGSNARARAFIGTGGAVTDTLELAVYVVVGPAFAELDGREGGGPFVLGFDLGLRAYAAPLSARGWNLFAEPFVMADLRLPGLDAGGGLRAGALWWLSREVAIEASLSGAAVAFGAAPPEGEDTQAGFTGGLRLGIRFGPERREAAP